MFWAFLVASRIMLPTKLVLGHWACWMSPRPNHDLLCLYVWVMSLTYNLYSLPFFPLVFPLIPRSLRLMGIHIATLLPKITHHTILDTLKMGTLFQPTITNTFLNSRISNRYQTLAIVQNNTPNLINIIKL